MAVSQLNRLHQDLYLVAGDSMDEVPSYGVFAGGRARYANRVIAVAYQKTTGEPAAFTALVYLPIERSGRTEVVVHLGLTMIRRGFRGQRIQTPLLSKVFLLPVWNLMRLRFTVTNIAASPAGIGAVSDYFLNVYPEYKEINRPRRMHLSVAEQVLEKYRHEFGCSTTARFNPETFVVHGSNDPAGGGAYQFIKHDPVSRYRHEACNRFCSERLNFSAGDELFQVGEVDLFRSLWASRTSRRKAGTRHPNPPEARQGEHRPPRQA